MNMNNKIDKRGEKMGTVFGITLCWWDIPAAVLVVVLTALVIRRHRQ